MNLIVETVNDCAEKVKIECSPVEWLVINKAIRLLSENPDVSIDDMRRAKQLFSTEPEIREIEK